MAKLLLIRPPARLQTPVYALFNVPTIVCGAILLTIRHLGIALPSEPPTCWWQIFDAEWDDVWSVAGHIMRLYRKRDDQDKLTVMGLPTKKEVRRWIETNSNEKNGVKDVQ